jgi:hypothetical protein
VYAGVGGRTFTHDTSATRSSGATFADDAGSIVTADSRDAASRAAVTAFADDALAITDAGEVTTVAIALGRQRGDATGNDDAIASDLADPGDHPGNGIPQLGDVGLVRSDALGRERVRDLVADRFHVLTAIRERAQGNVDALHAGEVTIRRGGDGRRKRQVRWCIDR